MKNSKKLIIISWWVFGFLLINSLNNVNAITFKQADSLYNKCLYPEACIAYEQIIFENQGDENIKAHALLRKSYCYKAESNYASIDKLLTRCNLHNLNDSLRSLILFEQAFACYMSEDFLHAKERILPLFNINTSYELDKASVFLYSLILNELNSWEESKINLVSFLQRAKINKEEKRDSLIQEVNLLYQKDNIPKIKKIKLARTLSFILPGMGQAYAGNVGKGLISFSLVALSGTYTYLNLVHPIYTSSAVGLYLFTYFYFGNINQLNKMINQSNLDTKNAFNSSVSIKLTNLNSKLKGL